VLILFDIDATLITTSRAGVAAMADAGRELFRPDFSVDGTEFAGRLDPLIVVDLLRSNGVDVSDTSVRSFRDGYRRHLAPKLTDRERCRALPGVLPLVKRLREREDVVVGLLTGNYPETGSMKLRACGIDPDWFTIRVWGDESPHEPPSRDHLPAIGLERYRRHAGRDVHAGIVTVIGDTPHDVRCAQVYGCRSLAVATGSFDEESLWKSGADRVVPDLSDTGDVLAWLVGPESN
jgi:phosphoglycolate phosphatase-like HAD superfamily hydrolase